MSQVSPTEFAIQIDSLREVGHLLSFYMSLSDD